MKAEQKMSEFTLRLICIVVWFEILWAIVFLLGIVFQWSGLTAQLSIAFFGSGFCGVLVLVALAVLNVTANMNIISKAQIGKLQDVAKKEEKAGAFIITLGIAIGLIAIVVFSIWFAEWRLYEAKVAENEAKLESIADSKLAIEALDLIKRDGTVKELLEIRDALSASILSGGRLSIIFPLEVKGVAIYYELTAWWYKGNKYSAKLSQASLTKFIPKKDERKKFKKLTEGEIEKFSVASGDDLRAFMRIESNGTHAVLLIDTSRRSDYSRSSFR